MAELDWKRNYKINILSKNIIQITMKPVDRIYYKLQKRIMKMQQQNSDEMHIKKFYFQKVKKEKS